MSGLSCYPGIHALIHARTHTIKRKHTRASARAQSEVVYDVFYTEYSEIPTPILKIYSKIKKTEMLMLFKLFLYSDIDVL